MIQAEPIIIGLQVQEQVIDLKIPTAVTISRLKELLREALSLLQISLPLHFHLELKYKPLVLAEQAVVSDYPIGNGDQLVVVPYNT